MTYAIAHVIYGIPLTPNAGEAAVSRALRKAGRRPDEGRGFLGYYSGSADEHPAAFGVKLDDFDEACAYTELSQLCLTPTPAQLATYQGLLAQLNEGLRTDLLALGAPRVFFLWGTS